jgi:hypothetical protein
MFAAVVIELRGVSAIEHLPARRTHHDVLNVVFGFDAGAHLLDARRQFQVVGVNRLQTLELNRESV